jgi:hypothetical protein
MDETKLSALLDATVRICCEVFGAEHVETIIQHGSSFKGGAIPGYSDIDLHVYLTADCFDVEGRLSDEAIFAFQEPFGALPWKETGYYYPQVYFLDKDRHPAGWIGQPPGTYRELYGRLPESLIPTPEQVREAAQYQLERLPRDIAFELDAYLDATPQKLPRLLRLLGTVVTPTIFALQVRDAEEPAAVWALSKFEALEQLEARYAVGAGQARRFYELIAHAYGGDAFDVSAAHEAFRVGIGFLRWVEANHPKISFST